MLNELTSEKPAAWRKSTEKPRMPLPQRICAAQTTQFCCQLIVVAITHNFGSSQVGSFKAIEV